MSKRRRDANVGDLVGSIMGFISIVVLLYLIVTDSPNALFHFAFLLVLVFVVGISASILRWREEKRRLANSGIAEIDQMDGPAFEKYLRELFRRLGYRVEVTRGVGDFGADLIIIKDSIRTVIQAKRWSKNVGVRALPEALAAQKIYDCTASLVVTNRDYTEQARRLAKANAVALWDRDDLIETILSTQKDGPESRGNTFEIQSSLKSQKEKQGE